MIPVKIQALREPTIEVIDMNNGNGFTIILINETTLTDHYDHFIHKINLTTLEQSIIIFEKLIYKAKQTSPAIMDQMNRINQEFETLIPHNRAKRQFVMAAVGIGSALVFLYGMMSKTDTQNIQNHLDTLERSHNEAVDQLNKQIVINSRFEYHFSNITKTMNQQADKIERKLNEFTIKQDGQLRNLYQLEYETLIREDAKNILEEIHKIKEIMLSARLGILNRDILTPREIRDQNITLPMLSQLGLKIALYKNCILLIIEIPRQTNENYKNLLIQPIPNKDNHMELRIEPTYVLEKNNSIFYPTQKKEELRKIKDTCLTGLLTIKPFGCSYHKNTDESVKILGTNTLMIINLKKQEIKQTCNTQPIVLSGTYMIKMRNCEIKFISNNVTFIHDTINIIYEETYILPNTLKEINYTDVTNITLEKIHLSTFENTKNLEKVKQENTVHQNQVWLVVLTFIMSYIICKSYLHYKKRGINVPNIVLPQIVYKNEGEQSCVGGVISVTQEMNQTHEISQTYEMNLTHDKLNHLPLPKIQNNSFF